MFGICITLLSSKFMKNSGTINPSKICQNKTVLGRLYQKFTQTFCILRFAVMHLGAVASLLFRHHNNKTIQDLLRRLDSDKLIGTLVFSDPATGTQM